MFSPTDGGDAESGVNPKKRMRPKDVKEEPTDDTMGVTVDGYEDTSVSVAGGSKATYDLMESDVAPESRDNGLVTWLISRILIYFISKGRLFESTVYSRCYGIIPIQRYPELKDALIPGKEPVPSKWFGPVYRHAVLERYLSDLIEQTPRNRSSTVRLTPRSGRKQFDRSYMIFLIQSTDQYKALDSMKGMSKDMSEMRNDEVWRLLALVILLTGEVFCPVNGCNYLLHPGQHVCFNPACACILTLPGLEAKALSGKTMQGQEARDMIQMRIDPLSAPDPKLTEEDALAKIEKARYDAPADVKLGTVLSSVLETAQMSDEQALEDIAAAVAKIENNTFPSFDEKSVSKSHMKGARLVERKEMITKLGYIAHYQAFHSNVEYRTKCINANITEFFPLNRSIGIRLFDQLDVFAERNKGQEINAANVTKIESKGTARGSRDGGDAETSSGPRSSRATLQPRRTSTLKAASETDAYNRHTTSQNKDVGRYRSFTAAEVLDRSRAQQRTEQPYTDRGPYAEIPPAPKRDVRLMPPPPPPAPWTTRSGRSDDWKRTTERWWADEDDNK
jgi:hypothetical protein